MEFKNHLKEDLIEYKGVYCRKDNSNDKGMIKDCINHYNHFNLDDNSTIMDMGTHVGGFAKMCKDKNVKQYIGFEADPENHSILKYNAPKDSILNLGCISASTDKTLTFYQNNSKSSKCSGTVEPKSNRSKSQRKVRYEVNNFNIVEMLNKHKPTHVKVDIEGAEYAWLEVIEGKFPEHIKEISFEVHHEEEIQKFSETYLPIILEDFDLIAAIPCSGFYNSESELKKIVPLNIEYKGSLFGVDIFFRRK